MGKLKLPKAASKHEATLELQFKVDPIMSRAAYGKPVREYTFDNSGRKWRFDFAWPSLMFAVEVEGLTHDGGRHQRIAGFEADLVKYQAAMLQGWTVYRVSPKQIASLQALETIKTMLSRLLCAQ